MRRSRPAWIPAFAGTDGVGRRVDAACSSAKIFSMTYDADVIIAGAGMTGATLALALASGGLKAVLIDPMVVETQTAPSFDGRASAIAFSSFRQWLQIGVGVKAQE